MDANLYKVGQIINAVSARLERAQTKPPPYYTEESLMNDMCSAYKFVKNEEDRAILRQVAGIGTARTRGTIIENLIRRGFVVRKKVGKSQQLHITPEGRNLLESLPDEIKDISLTAKWERALGMVAEGKASSAQLIDKVAAVLRQMIPNMLADDVDVRRRK